MLASAQERRQARALRAVRAPQRGLTALRPGEPVQALELRQVLASWDVAPRQMLAALQPDEPAQALELRQVLASWDGALRQVLAVLQPDEPAQAQRQAWKVMMASAPEQVLAQQDARRRTAACCSGHGSTKTSALKQAPEQPVVAQPGQRALRGAALARTQTGRPLRARALREEPPQASRPVQAQALRKAANCSDRASGPIPDAGRAVSSARTTGRRRRVRSSTCADHYAHSRGRQDRIRPWASAPRRRRPCPVRTRRRLCRAATRPDAWPEPVPHHALRCWSVPAPDG